MMQLRWLHVLVVACLCTPGVDANERPTELQYRIYLTDGTVRYSATLPRPAFDKLRVRAEETYEWLPLGVVDMTRSRENWAEMWPWENLDTHPMQGKSLAIDEYLSRADVRSRLADRPVILVEIWSSWCAPCRQHLADLRRQLMADGWLKKVDVLSLCVGESKEQWASALKTLGLTPVPGWADVFVPTDNATALQRILDGASSVSFVVTRDRKVVHSRLDSRVVDWCLRDATRSMK